MAESCECGNEPSGSIKCWKFLDYLRTLAFYEGLYSMQLVGWLVGWLVGNLTLIMCLILVRWLVVW